MMESYTLDRRFLFRGELPSSSELVLVVVGGDSLRESNGVTTDFRKACAVLVNGLEKMGAKIIALDYYFEGARLPSSDSLLCAAIKNAGKIVLVGSIDEHDHFKTPYTDAFPGVYLHATALDNILQKQFIIKCSRNVTLLIGTAVAGALFVIFIYLPPIGQRRQAVWWEGASVLTLMFGYAALALALFSKAGLIVPVAAIAGFIAAAGGLHMYYGHVLALRANARLQKRIEHLLERAKVWLARPAGALQAGNYYRLFAFAFEELERGEILHWLVQEPVKEPFLPKPKTFSIEPSAIAKLMYDIEQLRRGYFDYIQNRAKEPRLIERLQRIGARITREFGLAGTLHDLLQEGSPHAPLRLVVNDLRVPWRWAFDQTQTRFLCEDFALGTPFATEREIHDRRRETEPQPHAAEDASRSAILFYGDWQGHQGKELKDLQNHIQELQTQFIHRHCATHIIHDRSQDFLSRLAQASSENGNLRLIHYTGHAEKGFLDVGPQDSFRPGQIFDALGPCLASRPLVFLNACSSGVLPERWDKRDHLCTEFLACGAGACIVTSFEVYEKTARSFAQIFYHYFITQGLTAGEALQRAINDLGRPDKESNYDPDCDLTRYFYQLFGDPGLKF